MSLYGALFSGVSGLAAQSSAMGAIADNVTNVNTSGYKSTAVQFSTLVTKQVSQTRYAPGGVQAAPRTGVDVQGLLQSTSSATDVSISGGGFFIVNEQPNAGNGSLFAYTRAGSFQVDKDGYLQNTSGWYLQGWPLQPAGNNTSGFVTITEGNDTFTKSYQDSDGDTQAINDNIVSTSDLKPINLNTIGGTASETKNVNLGANLPAGDDVGDTHKTNVVMYDTLGIDHNLEMTWTKDRENAWGVDMPPPTGAATLELHGTDDTDTTPDIYAAAGQIEFTAVPEDGDQVVIDGITYVFDTNDTVTNTPTTRKVDISATTVTSGSEVVPILKTAIDASDMKDTDRYTANGNILQIKQSTMGGTIAVDVSGTLAVKQIAANNNTGTFTVEQIDYSYKNGARFDFTNAHAAADSTNPFVITDPGAETITAAAGTFSGFTAGDVVFITNPEDATNKLKATIASVATNGSNITFADGTLPTTNASDTTMNIIQSYDTDQVKVLTGSNAEQTFELRQGSLSPQATGTNTFTVANGGTTMTAIDSATFYGTQAGDTLTVTNAVDAGLNTTYTVASVSADGKIVTITGTFSAAETSTTMSVAVSNSSLSLAAIPDGAGSDEVASSLATAIKANSLISTTARFSAEGASLVFSQSSVGDAVQFNVEDVSRIASVYANTTTETEATASNLTNFTVAASTFGAKKAAISFNGDGTPSEINIDNIDVQWANGASDQEYTSSADDTRISMFLGNTNVADGMTQFSGAYQINYISQNGAQFGNFAGISIGNDGIVTALFDNGVTRPVFMIPVATFVNPNQMSSLSGNVYIETDFSGQPTVREAGKGGAGEMTGASLEASTVDLGEEFTSMITTQRAYSAAAKIISTADQMLEELLRVKR